MSFLRNNNGRPVSRRGVAVAVVFLLFACSGKVIAQNLSAKLTIASIAPARLRIQLAFPTPTSSFSFRNSYAGILGLGERIEQVTAEFHGKNASVRKLGSGEYETDQQVTRLDYEVALTGLAQPAQMSHVSWVNNDGGLLMLSDLLPRSAKKSGDLVRVEIAVPSRWSVESNLSGREPGYSTTDPENTVFMVGPALRKKVGRVGQTNLVVNMLGKWPFSEGDALKIAGKLMEEHTRVTGYPLKNDAVIMLVPFAGDTGPERWTAETRGNAVVMLLGNDAGRKRVLGKLGIVLAHEIFHLWVPNALTLSGNYDWFFEGFTLYQALRTALRLKLISFETYLETLARVYSSYLASSESVPLSLIEASERRWTTASSLVYDQGVLVAFAYDLQLRLATDCGQSLDDVYRQLFKLHATGQGPANETIIKLLNETARTSSFGRDFVESRGRIDIQSTLSPFGLQLGPGGGLQAPRLSVANNLSNTQRQALRCLGYRG